MNTLYADADPDCGSGVDITSNMQYCDVTVVAILIKKITHRSISRSTDD